MLSCKLSRVCTTIFCVGKIRLTVVYSFPCLQVKVGDTLDLIIGEDKETETAVVMRIVLKKASEKNENDKYKVVLRRWKNLKVPKQDVFK